MNTPWNGKQYSLEKFTGLHRIKFAQLEEAAQHVGFQIPTEHSRVGFLLDNIKSKDPYLASALGNVRLNTNGMRTDFEKTVAFILPVCPFSKGKSEKEKLTAQVGASILKNASDSKTGVDFRWYKRSEYMKLTPEQKSELYEWQNSKEGKAQIAKERKQSPTSNSNRKTKKQLAAQVKDLKAKLHDSQNSTDTDEKIAACIASVIPKEPVNGSSSATTATQSPNNYILAAQKVQKILKRKRDGCDE